MNSKAIRKQLLAAVAMVLVAAVALGSSTYAWFVASGTVKAEGMKVQAQSEGGLAISFGGTAWGTSATAGMDPSQKLYPASTKDLVDWYHATAEDTASYAALAGTRTKITGDVFAEDGKFQLNNYVVMKPFLIKSTASDKLSKGLYVDSIEVTTPTGYTMSTALRVGVSYTTIGASPTTTSYIYGPVKVGDKTSDGNIPTDGYAVYQEYIANDTTNSEKQIGTVNLATTGKGNSDLIGETVAIPADGTVEVKIFVWFEGEDRNLKSSNFNVEDLSVSVKFSSMSGPSGANNTISKVNLYGATASGSAVEAKQPGSEQTASYYVVNKKGANYETLYTTQLGALTEASVVYTISGGQASVYNLAEYVAPSSP